MGELFGSRYIDHQRPEWLDTVGPEEFRQIVELARKSIPGLVVTIEEPVVVTDQAIAGRLRWTGDTVERETIELMRLDNGKVVEHWGAEQWSRKRQV